MPAGVFRAQGRKVQLRVFGEEGGEEESEPFIECGVDRDRWQETKFSYYQFPNRNAQRILFTMPHGERIAELLLHIDACRFTPQRPIIWPGGIKAPMHIDVRLALGHAQAQDLIVEALASRVRSLHVPPDVIAGVSPSGADWAPLVAKKLDLPCVLVWSMLPKGVKTHIDGSVQEGTHAVLIDDVISTGRRTTAAAHALCEEGKVTLTDIVSIFSYGMPDSLEYANEERVQLHPLFDIDTLLKTAINHDLLNEEDRREILAFAKDHEAWAKTR